MSEEKAIVYTMIFDIPKDGAEVKGFVNGMSECLLALEDINHAIISSIDETIEVVSFIENIEAGSILYKLKDVVKKITKNGDGAIDLISAHVAHGYGVGVSMTLSVVLKYSRDKIMHLLSQDNINNKEDYNEKETECFEKIDEEIKKIQSANNLIHELNKDKLKKATRRMIKGIKVANVRYQSSDDVSPIKLSTKFAEFLDIDTDIADVNTAKQTHHLYIVS